MYYVKGGWEIPGSIVLDIVILTGEIVRSKASWWAMIALRILSRWSIVLFIRFC